MWKNGFIKNILKGRIERHQVYKDISRSGLFDREYYLRSNLEVAQNCIDPIKHYLQDGWRQNKNPNTYFDTAWYLQSYPEVRDSSVNPLFHYINFGWKQGYDPSSYFSTREYFQQHPDLRQDGCEPLSHFLKQHKTELEVISFTHQSGRTDNFGKVAIHAHIYYTDLVSELIEYINHVPGKVDCFFTTDTFEKRAQVLKTVDKRLNAAKVEIRMTPNIGRDIAPLVVGCRDILSDYEFICHIHTKKALHTSENDYGDTWRKDLLEHLLGSQQQTRMILNYFNNSPDVGLLFPQNFIPIQKYLEFDINQWNLEYLAERIGLELGAPREIICPAGSMFWARAKALKKLYDAVLSYTEFDGEAGQLDGTLAHALERLFVYIASSNGYVSRMIGSKV